LGIQHGEMLDVLPQPIPLTAQIRQLRLISRADCVNVGAVVSGLSCRVAGVAGVGWGAVGAGTVGLYHLIRQCDKRPAIVVCRI
jgi:hypothetical protein